MFSGIIEEIGEISDIKRQKNSYTISVKCKKVLENTKLGDSIAVNGICFTVTGMSTNTFTFDVMPETIKLTSLKNINAKSKVNLERALSLLDRLGGHIVTGHIDGIGTIAKIQKDENAIRYKISTKKEILDYIVKKGSIAMDGISLTVTDVTNTDFGVSVIPHSLDNTILSQKNIGDIINLETDIIGKYVEKMLKNDTKKSDITKEFLLKHGF